MRPLSCPASFTKAGASSSIPVRLSSARQADIQQDEHNSGGETSSGHYRDSTYVAVKPAVPLSSSLSIPTSDRLLRPSIDCGAAPGRRKERLPGFQASDERPPSIDHPSAPANVSSVQLSLSSDHQADLGWKVHPPCLQVANVHHASCQRVVVEPVELWCSSPSSLSNNCHADRGQDARHPGRQALNVHQQTPRTSYSSTLTFLQATVTQNPGFDTKLRSVGAYGLGQSSSCAAAHQVRQMTVVLTAGRMLATRATKH